MAILFGNHTPSRTLPLTLYTDKAFQEVYSLCRLYPHFKGSWLPKHKTYSQSAPQKVPPILRVLCVIPRATFNGRGSILERKMSTLNLLKTSCEEKQFV